VVDIPRFPVRFDSEAFAEDLHHATAAGRAVGTRERGRLEREGVVATELFGCDPEPRDGTRLAGCVKTYLPQPDGGWGMVFSGDRDAHGGPILVVVAFGVRHPVQAWQPSVYQVAHRRLNG